MPAISNFREARNGEKRFTYALDRLAPMKFKKLLLQTARSLGVEIRRYTPASYSTRCVSLAANPDVPTRGTVLLSYILAPFLLKPGQSISRVHNHHLESTLIARTFQDLGYAVDVIDFHNNAFIPVKDYAFFVSARTHLETISKRLNGDCIKIAHLDTAHFLFNNTASYTRALALQQRRGITLPESMRLIENNRGIESADYGVVLGNLYTVGTYRYAGKPLFALPAPAAAISHPWNDKKDFDAARNRFLWLGSAGFVHKGLDLVLETFANTPKMHLTVCGPIKSEHNFRLAYHKELFDTTNIHTIGWVDIAGDEFRHIAEETTAVVYPSCAEGQVTSVLNCMRAGLIPVITRESGIDIADFGVMLKDASIDAIRKAIESLASLPASRLRDMSRKAWEYANENHSAEKYCSEYRNILMRILADRSV